MRGQQERQRQGRGRRVKWAGGYENFRYLATVYIPALKCSIIHNKHIAPVIRSRWLFRERIYLRASDMQLATRTFGVPKIINKSDEAGNHFRKAAFTGWVVPSTALGDFG